MNQHRAPMGLMALTATACLCALINVTSCGGGSSAPVPGGPQQGSGTLPGQQGTTGNVGTGGTGATGGSGGLGSSGGGTGPTSPTSGWGAGYYTPQPVENTAGGSAPLGTVPEYNVTEVGGSTNRESSRVTSLVVGEYVLTFAVLDATMAANGQAPNWDATTASFQEGAPVDIWMKYELDPNFPLNRSWTCKDIGLEYYEPNVPHAENGVYTTKLDYTIPWGTAKSGCELLVGVSHGDESDVLDAPFTFDVTSAGAKTRSLYPTVPNYVKNDSQGGGCKPSFVAATFNGTEVTCESAKDLSNVVLKFSDGTVQKWDGLTGKSGTFYGTGDSAGKTIAGVWIKSGCNASGDGPGYGEYLANTEQFKVAFAQMVFEDLIGSNDYDYNDFVGRMNAIETKNSAGNLVQIQFTLKAVARSAGYDSDWQFNINGAFPGASATAVVNQYYINGTRHGYQKIWRSSNGASVPIFTPIRGALPNPPGSWSTNGVPGTQYIDGDYAEVTVIFDNPVAAGTYTPAPYSPELRVVAGAGTVYTIGLWKQKGDPVDASGRPLAFIVPDTYAWPLEGFSIDTVYTNFPNWKSWINNQGEKPVKDWWTDTPASNYFRRELFL